MLSLSAEPGTDDMTCVAIHVHGGERAAAGVAAIVNASGHRALDTGTGGFFAVGAPEVGYAQWSACRDHVLHKR